jgi:hypothetical protein
MHIDSVDELILEIHEFFLLPLTLCTFCSFGGPSIALQDSAVAVNARLRPTSNVTSLVIYDMGDAYPSFQE